MAIALNSNTPVDVLEKLFLDSDQWVYLAAIANSKLPLATVAKSILPS